MNLIINGETHDMSVETIDEVVEHFGLQQGLVVAEVNGIVIERNEWENTTVTEGMRIELVHFVGGG
ncbi:sulfur carrier protein ThiS [Pseudalkalibacillus caeni]|uniref:Sulfur carrier protein ThiS n=1 Tax=Exobacillus caeni TaxID=2574798 RepID=A0A5R9F3Y9_9BACL|nr:sulfur carrier protein ThiS [Pseudalkalibacillus caeni]TLS36328.1 sulfur carrier protein ThiS [Pseudalkalibacillus caeni]